MATTIEQVIGKIKKGNALVDAYFKSKGKYVVLEDGTTVEAKFGAVGQQIAALPTNADVDNKINSKIASAYKAGGSKDSVAELPELAAANLGYVYNMTAQFTTTADFVEGANKKFPAGSDVGIVNVGTDESPVYKYNVLSGFIDTSVFVEKETGKGLSTNDFDNTYKNKVDGIAENATKVEASTTNGNIKINGTETKVYEHAGAHIFVGATEPQDMADGDIWFQTVEETVTDGE